MYRYDGKLSMHVPAHFDLPGNTKLFSAWELWLNRNPDYSCTNAGRETITSPICIFMKFTADSICKKLWKNFNNGRKKVLMMMDIAPGNERVSDFTSNKWGQITKANLLSSFDIGLQYVLTQAEYMCPMKYSTWSVTTWCKKWNRNAIMKIGFDNDKALVGAYNTRYNNSHKKKSKTKQSNIQVTVHRRRAGNI